MIKTHIKIINAFVSRVKKDANSSEVFECMTQHKAFELFLGCFLITLKHHFYGNNSVMIFHVMCVSQNKKQHVVCGAT